MPKRPPIRLPVVRPDAFPNAGRSVAQSCEPAEAHPDEFARSSSAPPNAFSRRDFLTYSSATLALAGLTGCSDRPREAIVPYVDPPEQVTPGEPQFFATTLTRYGYGRGVIVTSREGRPVKIEGNPDHPASLGAADAPMQAAILDLYDPLRSRAVTHAGRSSTWGNFETALRKQIASHEADRGRGLYILTGQSTSPTFNRIRTEWNHTFPETRWLAYESTGGGASARAAFLTSSQPQAGTESVYDLSRADVVVSFAADFLWDSPGSLAYARQFADRRHVIPGRPSMSRLYVAESDLTITGSKADHRLAVRPSRIGLLLDALRAQVGVGGTMPTGLSDKEVAWLSAAATDLSAARGRGLLLVGDDCAADLHAIADELNRHFGNAGQTVRRLPASALNLFDLRPDAQSLRTLVEAIRGQQVKTLLILADNPVRTATGDVPLGDVIADLGRRADAFTAHLGHYANETAYVCQWHAPASHELEQWGDATAFDGTTSLNQPLISPLTGGHSMIELLNTARGIERSDYETVRQTWRETQATGGNAEFDAWWAKALQAGVAGRPVPGDAGIAIRPLGKSSAPASGLELLLRPDYSIGDGGQFHNPWLQELPRPMTKIVWGNAALLSPATGERLGVSDEEVVRIAAGNRSIDIPALLVPGIADGTIVLHMGYGEHRVTDSDSKAVPAGVNVAALRSVDSMSWVGGTTITPLGRKGSIVRTHNHHSMSADAGRDASVSRPLTPMVVATPETSKTDLALHNRKLIRTATISQFARQPDFAPGMDEKEIHQLYPEWDYSRGPQWGMTIDLTTCIGCNACIVACQAENNIPSVGPEEVAREREMHWLRVDQYLDDHGHVHHQPVPCMHCENAPCEYVCPVAATTHSMDGLNQMTYNRCVGTRYCSNNCPYKVRRFNFFNYTAPTPQNYNMQRNPDVTVRTRGVMEKCTYCVQRIVYADRKAEIAALNSEGDKTAVRRDLISRLQTACQQTCPTHAIHFGDLANPDAPVTQEKRSPRNYGLLTELSTKPRTTYLASITNPSPAMEGGGA